jgi:putative MATE family efflux protein
LKITDFLRDREYYQRVFKLGLPITLQQLLWASLSMVVVMMVGQLGDTAVASVALANQIFFLLNLLLFGIVSGAAMFTAQLWGKGDVANIHRVMGLSLSMSLSVAVLFLLAAELIPETLLRIYTTDPKVIALGSEYLRLFGWSFLFFSILVSYASIMRSIGQVRLPVTVSICALTLNIILSYVLIFGKLGLPKMGVMGAAAAIVISRGLECVVLLFLNYRLHLPTAARLSEMVSFKLDFARKVLKPVLPVAINEILWSLGITAYSVIFARISTQSIAAMNIVGTFSDMAMVPFIGLASACAILVGNMIGRGEDRQAHNYAGRTLILSAGGALLAGGILVLVSPFILSVYKVSPLVIEYAQKALVIMAMFLWLRMINVSLFIGVLRAGGDTRYALILDGIIIWVVGVPLAFLGAFVFHLPVYLVYLLVMSEELAKGIFGVRRYLSHKWIHHLEQTV